MRHSTPSFASVVCDELFAGILANLRNWCKLSPSAKGSNPWIAYDKSQIWAIFRQKSTLGHKSTYSSFKKFLYKNFFCLIEFQLFHMSASFDLNFLAKSHTKYFQNGLKLLHLSQPSTWATVARSCYQTPQILISDFINFRKNQE